MHPPTALPHTLALLLLLPTVVVELLQIVIGGTVVVVCVGDELLILNELRSFIMIVEDLIAHEARVHASRH